MSQDNNEGGNNNGDNDYNSGMWMSNTITFPQTSTYRITYDYSNNNTKQEENEFIQPHTTPVAHFTSQTNIEQYNELIDISPSFIVYAVKNNLVRVIDRRNALRTLLRGHVGLPVTCLKFFCNKSIKNNTSSSNSSNSSDVLATVGGGGNKNSTIYIWRLYCNTEKNEIISERLLEIKYNTCNKIVWHPTNPNQLFIASNSEDKCSVFIETTRLITVSSNSIEGYVSTTTNGVDTQHAVCECKDKDLGNAVLLGNGDVVIDVDWNEIDSKYVIIALQNVSQVQLWDLSGWNNTTNSQLKKIGDGVSVSNVSRCAFVNHKKGTFITGSNMNKDITLWSSFFSTDGSGAITTPVPLQVWSFNSSTVSPPPSICFNVTVCYGGKDTSSYLLLADKNVGNLFALHIEQDRFTTFTPFSVIHPIVSWSVMSTPSNEPNHNNNVDVCLFCVQTKAVQMLRLKQKMLAPSSTSSSTTTTLPSYLSIQSQGEVMMLEATDDEKTIVMDIQEYDDDDDVDYDYSDDKEDEEDVAAPPATALPPPGLEGFSATDDTTKNNAFSNWLGSLAATSSSTTTTTPNILPPPPKVADPIISSNNTNNTVVTPSVILQPQKPANSDTLLSPTRFITKVDDKNNNDDKKIPTILKNTEQQQQASRKEEIIKSRAVENKEKHQREINSKPEKNNSNNRSTSSSTPSRKKEKQQQQQQPNTPQLTILKREDNNPSPPRALSSNSNIVTTSNNATITSNTNMEEITRKLFKKQETYIQNEIQRSIRQEIQTMLVPSLTISLSQVMDTSITKPLKDSISKNNISNKTSAADIKKENLHRAKEMSDIIVDNIKSPIVDTFHQTMREVMIPAFEAATQQMFTQVSNSLEQQLKVSQKESTVKSMQISSLESKIDSMSIALESISVEVTHLRTLVASIAADSKNGAGSNSDKNDDDGVAKTKQVTQEELLSLLNNQLYEEAFTKALSASSADMAVFCCKNTNSSILFEDAKDSSSDNTTPSLSQPILLCLMQQLGSVIPTADTSDLMEVLSWLQDICVVLEPNNKNIENHIADVLRQLVSNIKVKMAEGDMTFRRPLQMLLQVIRGIGIV